MASTSPSAEPSAGNATLHGDCWMRRAIHPDLCGKGVGGDGSVNDVPWDCHSNVQTNHRSCGLHVDQPCAAPLGDLKARGLLEDTLVIWAASSAACPICRAPRGATTIQMVSPCGWRAAARNAASITAAPTTSAIRPWRKGPVNHLHATYSLCLAREAHVRFNGRDFRLTGVAGNVINDILA